MVKMIVWGVFALSAVAGLSLTAADLTLKNGQVYRNYRIKSVNGNKTVVLYIARDGSPDSVEVDTDLLPDSISNALGIASSAGEASESVEKLQTPELVAAEVSAQIRIDLAGVSAKDTVGRQAAAVKAAETLKRNLLPFFTDAEFETVWNGSDGVLAKVTKVNKSSYIKSGDKVFIRSSSHLGNRFRAQVYATGCMMQFGNNEMLRVVTFDESSAIKFALENIFSSIGHGDLMKNSGTDRNADKNVSNSSSQTAVTPAQTPLQPIVNNYYLLDDNDDDYGFYVVRDGRSYFPAYRPANRPGSHRPVVRPENRPGSHRPVVRPENRPGERPESNRPSPDDKSPRDKSIIQRSNRKVHSYDHLPDWAQPRYAKP